MSAPSDPCARPLVATADDDLLDQVLAAATVAAVEVDVVHDVAGLRRSWRGVPLVLLGQDVAARLGSGRGHGPGDGLVLVTGDGGDPRVWADAVRLRAEHVAVLPGEHGWLVDRLGAGGGRDEGRVLAVLGGRGGAGASCLAAALALTAGSEGRASVLVDLDPLGGGADLVMGAEEVEGLRWSDLVHARGRLPARSLVAALPHARGAAVLAWDRAARHAVEADSVESVLSALRRGSDLVVVDLARGLDLTGETALRLADTTLLVVPAEVRAVASAARVVEAGALAAGDVRVVVRGPAPAHLDAETVARALGLPLQGWLAPEPGLAAALERGDTPTGAGRGPLAEFCRELLASLARTGVAA